METYRDASQLYEVERRALHAERPGFRIGELQIRRPSSLFRASANTTTSRSAANRELKGSRKHPGLLLTYLLLLALCGGCSRWKHPTDRALLDNFRTHKAGFEQLLRMFQEDEGLGRVAYDFTRPERPEDVGVTRERLEAYRGLFDELGLAAGVEGYGEKDSVLFYASVRGLSVSGSSKGYAYLEKRPELVVDGLDTYRSQDGRSFKAFRHIEGDWYLYLDFED